MPAEEAASLLSVDIEAITAQVTQEAAASERAAIEALPDDALHAEAQRVEAELASALATLAKKSAASASAGPPTAAAASTGPIAFFEGTPIDCGKIAAAVSAAELDAIDDLSGLITRIEAKLRKAEAALAK